MAPKRAQLVTYGDDSVRADVRKFIEDALFFESSVFSLSLASSLKPFKPFDKRVS